MACELANVSLGYNSCISRSHCRRDCWRTRAETTPDQKFKQFFVQQKRGIFSGDEVGSNRVAKDRERLHLRNWSRIVEKHKLSDAVDALEVLVQQGSHVDSDVYYGLLKRCMAEKHLALGTKVHGMAVKSGYELNTFVANHLICMYASHGRLTEASRVFETIPTPTRHLWASIIMAHARYGQPRQAIVLYRQMRNSSIKADDHIFVAVLKACAMAQDLASGREAHADILRIAGTPSMFVGNCLVDMYAKSGSLKDARMVFDSLPSKNVVTWTALIAGYSQHGQGQEALQLYACMQQEGITAANHVTFVCLLQACASTRALVLGYSQHALGELALNLYDSMQCSGLNPADAFTFVCLLQACSTTANLEKGKEIHAQISELGLEASDLYVANSLVDMYCKCGSMHHAQLVFDGLPSRDVVTWNALIAGYSRQGCTELVFDSFDRMAQEAVQPDEITFLSMLSACCHVGLLSRGEQYFNLMVDKYRITPTIELYSCMIDLLGRAGQVDRAMQMARTMPFQPDIVVWSSILGACRKWSKVELAREAFEHAVRLERSDSSPYILMSNIYAAANQPELAQEIEALRVKEQAWKKQGQCWLADMSGDVHAFVVEGQ